MQINFAIPPISHFRRWLGEFFSLFQSYEISITLSINSLEKPKTFWTFHDSPYVRVRTNASGSVQHIYHFGDVSAKNTYGMEQRCGFVAEICLNSTINAK